MEDIRLYSDSCWKREVKDVLNLCSHISGNMNIIKMSVDINHERQILASFANRIKEEFTENPNALSLATEINYHVNAYFFSFSDPVKHIFSYLLPEYTCKEFVRCKHGMSPLKLVSKSFYRDVCNLTKQWVESNFIRLNYFKSIITADDAIKYTQTHNLKKINLLDFLDLRENHLETLVAQNIHSLIIGCQNRKEWPKMESLRHIKAYSIGNDALAKFAIAFPNLTSLQPVSGYITDVGLEAFTKACHQLQQIDLSYSGITDVGLV